MNFGRPTNNISFRNTLVTANLMSFLSVLFDRELFLKILFSINE